jgi:hypothetical protein
VRQPATRHRPHAGWLPVWHPPRHTDAPAVSLWIWRAAVLHAPAPALATEPNSASGRNTHHWDGVLSPRSILDLSAAGPATPRSVSAVTAYLSDRPNRSTFHSKQDCVPPPQVPSVLASVPIVQATASRGADAERCRCSCGAGVLDEKRNSPTGNRWTQRSCDHRTSHGSKKRIKAGKLAPRQACPKYAQTAGKALGTLDVSA